MGALMNIFKITKIVSLCLLSTSLLAACNKCHMRNPKTQNAQIKKSSISSEPSSEIVQLKSKAKKELIAGSTIGAISAGTATAGISSIFLPMGLAMFLSSIYIFLPIALITAPIAGIFIAKGIKNSKKVKQIKKIAQQENSGSIDSQGDVSVP